jgi:serine/threonine protein kinase
LLNGYFILRPSLRVFGKLMLLGKVLLKRYKIIEEIGSGAFANTYIAIDTAFPGEPRLVVKHLSPNNNEPDNLKIAKRLFETEAKPARKFLVNHCKK